MNAPKPTEADFQAFLEGIYTMATGDPALVTGWLGRNIRTHLDMCRLLEYLPRVCAVIISHTMAAKDQQIEPPRDVRRVDSLEGSFSWHVPRGTRPSCVSAQSVL